MQTTETQTVEVVDNELRALLGDLHRASSATLSISSRGLRLQLGDRRWTPTFGYVDNADAAAGRASVSATQNQLRMFVALVDGATSVRFAIDADGMRVRVDGGRWTPAFGYVERGA